jgi:uncharacterized protein
MKSVVFALLFSSMALTAHAASFDCAKAQTAVEKLICSDTDLSDLDAKLGGEYKQALASADNVDALKAEQRTWIANVRNKCGDTACMTLAYEARRAELAAKGQAQATLAANQTAASAAPEASPAAAATAAKPADVAPPAVNDLAPAPAQASAPTPAAAAASTASIAAQPAALPADPGFGITDVFHGLFALGMLALIAGLFKPGLAGGLMRAPTRGKIFACSLVFLVPMALGAEWSKSRERKAYDTALHAERERQQDEARRQKQALADAAAVKAAAARPVKTAYTNGQGVADGVCGTNIILMNIYMDERLAGKGRDTLARDIEERSLDYPANIRASVKNVWSGSLAVLDRHEGTWMGQSSDERQYLSIRLGGECIKLMKRSGIN